MIGLYITMTLLVGGCASQDFGKDSAKDSAGVSGLNPAIVSGLQPGDDIVPWNPIHVSGPDAGTNACPVCTYGERPAIVIFARDGVDVPRLAEQLDTLVVEQKSRQLKGFLIVLDTTPQKLKQAVEALHVVHIGICYPDPGSMAADLKAYKINPAAENTVMIYAKYKVTSNFVDLRPEKFDQVAEAISHLH